MSSTIATDASTFHRFMRLPPELRGLIWHSALEEAHKGRSFAVWFYERTPGHMEVEQFIIDKEVRHWLPILLSCKEAKDYAVGLLVKQCRRFPDVKVGTTPAENPLYDYHRIPNLEFDTFKFQGIFESYDPTTRAANAVWHPDVIKDKAISRVDWPSFVDLVCHVSIHEPDLIDLLHSLTLYRAGRTGQLDFRRLFLGPVAGSKLQTCTFRLERRRSTDMTFPEYIGLRWAEIDVERILHELEGYVLESVLKRYSRSEYFPRGKGWRRSWLFPELSCCLSQLQEYCANRRQRRQPIWSEQDRHEWLDQIRSFWGKEVHWLAAS